MIEALNRIDSNTAMLYTFRFGTSDKLVHLTQQQLDRIPYLFSLVAHKDDFSSIRNENGEFVLNPPIQYTSFMPIFRSITSEHPYILFNELPEDENVLDTLQLFDYLGINSFSLPLLTHGYLARTNPTNTDNGEERVKYHKANISEARQTAAEFIIALSKNEYSLRDSDTVNRIFSLIEIILSNEAVFNSRFRHHTLTVVKECCYPFFSKKQQRLLPTTQQIAQYHKIYSLMYLYDDDKPLPDNFQSRFAWRGVYVPIEENSTDSLAESSKNSPFPSPLSESIYYFSLFKNYEADWWFLFNAVELPIYLTKQNGKNNEVQSAISGRFNTLPRRPNVDKFKHRFGPKAQKYR